MATIQNHKSVIALVAIVFIVTFIGCFFIGARYGDIRTLYAESNKIETDQNLIKLPAKYKKFSFTSQMSDGNIVTVCIIYDKKYPMGEDKKIKIDHFVSNALFSSEIICE